MRPRERKVLVLKWRETDNPGVSNRRDLVPARVERMVPYKPGKPVEELERELGIQGAVKLASNENPYGAAPEVREVLRKALENLGEYPDGAAFALRNALASHLGVEATEVVTANGSNELIDLICRTYPETDDHVVFGKPSFVCYWLGCIAAGVDFTEVPLRDNLAWDVDALLEAVTPATKVLFLANPNNPTGAHMGSVDLERLVRELPERVVLVVDEAYVEFADAEDFVSALKFRELRKRLLILRTFSKAYGLASLRVGYAVGPSELIDYLHRMRAPFNVNRLAQLAAVEALKAQDYLQSYIQENRSERRRVAKALENAGIRVAPSQTNFLLVDVERSGVEVYEELLREAVIVRPMPPPIQTWLRITLGTPKQNEQMIVALRKVLGKSG
jgi:histidinol-phosphate aminotransferase